MDKKFKSLTLRFKKMKLQHSQEFEQYLQFVNDGLTKLDEKYLVIENNL